MSKTNFKKDKTKDKNQAVHLEKKDSTSSKDEVDKISLFGDKKESGRGILRKESGKLSSINDSARKSGVFSNIRFFHKDKKRIGKDGTENPELPEVVNNRKVILPEETQKVPSILKTLTLPVNNSESQKRWSSYEPLGRNQWEPTPTSILNSTVITSNRSLSEESLILTLNPNINTHALSTTNLPDITTHNNKLDIPSPAPSLIPDQDDDTDANINNQNELSKKYLKDKISELDNKISKAFQERSDILKKICTSLKCDNSENEIPLKGDSKFKVAIGETFESLDLLNKYIIENLLVSSQPIKEMAITNKSNLADIVCQLSSHIHQLNNIYNDNSSTKNDNCVYSKSRNELECSLAAESNHNRNLDENFTEKSNLISLDSYSSSETLIDSSTPKLTDVERKSSRPDVTDLASSFSLNIKESLFCPMSIDSISDEVSGTKQPIIETDVNKGAKSPNSRILNVCSLPSISEDKDECFDSIKSPDSAKNEKVMSFFQPDIVLKLDGVAEMAVDLNSRERISSDIKNNSLLETFLPKSTSNTNSLISENLSSESNNTSSMDGLNLLGHVGTANILINDFNGSIQYIDHSSIEEGLSECEDRVICADKEILNAQVIDFSLSNDASFKMDIIDVLAHEIINDVYQDLKNHEINGIIKDFIKSNNCEENPKYRSPTSNICFKSESDENELNDKELSLAKDFSFADDKLLIENHLTNNLSSDNADSDIERLQNELLDLIPKTLNYDSQDEFLPNLYSGSNCLGNEHIEGLHCQKGINESNVDFMSPHVCDTQIPISINNDLNLWELNDNTNILCITEFDQMDINIKRDINKGKPTDILIVQNDKLINTKDNRAVTSTQNDNRLSISLKSNNNLLSNLDNNSLLSIDDNDNIELIIEKMNNISITSKNNTPNTSISDINLSIDFNASKDLSDSLLYSDIDGNCNNNTNNFQSRDNNIYNGLLNSVYINCEASGISNNQNFEKAPSCNFNIDCVKNQTVDDSSIDIFPEKLSNSKGSISNNIFKENVADSMCVDIENMLNSDIKSSDIITSEDIQLVMSENLNETIV